MGAPQELGWRVADNVPSALVYLDADLRIQFANRYWLDLLGYAPREMVDRTLAEVLDARTFEYARARGAALKHGQASSIDFVLRHKDGTPRYLKVNVLPECDAEGRSIGYYASTSDGSAERSTHAALRVAQQRLGLALDAAEAGIWEWDLAARREYYSDGFKALLGYRQTNFPCQFEFFSRLHPDDAEATLDAMAAAVVEGRDFDREFRMGSADGSYRWLRGVGRACRDPKTGAVLCCAGTVRDISTRKQAEQQLADARTLLDAVVGRVGCAIIATDAKGRILQFNSGAERLLGIPAAEVVGRMFIDDFQLDPAQLSLITLPGEGGHIVVGQAAAAPVGGAERSTQEFLARAGHDARTPLASVIAALELLREGVGGRLDVAAENLLGLALQNAGRLERWIDELLELERIELDAAPGEADRA
jgi:PAS domain S-box-containing protein